MAAVNEAFRVNETGFISAKPRQVHICIDCRKTSVIGLWSYKFFTIAPFFLFER